MNQNGLFDSLPPGMTFADKIRFDRQMEVIRKTGCIAGCEQTDLSTALVLHAVNGVLKNERVRCAVCLAYYEVTPNCEIVNVRHIVEADGPRADPKPLPKLEKA